ncbi:MAG TPA: alkaline phosphatase family protein [Kineosporiaceae bacterium]|nr:alkaline phosphatase family protein [Kineosporiaceae bacterium]
MDAPVADPDPDLADVLPSVAAALGLPVRGPGRLPLPSARSAVVVLVDGLGQELLARRGGHAPFLRSIRDGRGRAITVDCGFPSTTATSMGTFGTARHAGVHGLVGMNVLNPELDLVFSELAWDPRVDPFAWQPQPTVFEELAATGLPVVMIAPPYFDNSGLTLAALRGARFVAAQALDERVDAALAALATHPQVLVYLYWGEVDKTGHVHGCDSWEWGEELERVDAALARLARSVGPDVLVTITADHGMVDVPHADRVDLADEPELRRGLRHLGGEARALHLYCEPDAVAGVAAAWRTRLGSAMEIVERADAVRRGWFGPVAPHVAPRIGDLLAVAVDRIAVVDSATARPELMRLIGQHGARTPEESLVPVLAVLGGR